MSTNTEELNELQHKIDWEGGLIEYVCGYGGDMPDELKEQTKAVKVAVSELEDALEGLLEEHNLEPF